MWLDKSYVVFCTIGALLVGSSLRARLSAPADGRMITLDHVSKTTRTSGHISILKLQRILR